ncbi:glycosyltransferase [Candidatus Roizmanbacteria bacterium]|nr:glycosyltransferase [Candidatus Roizmanbacteria bacterium]
MEKQTYFFTIIIPTLNEEKFLPKLLKNLAQQKMRNFEVIVVDAMSQDTTKSIVLSFLDKFPLLFIESKKKGVSHQRNVGAEHAKGEYLIMLDADCSISPFFTKKAYSEIKKNKGLIFFPYFTPDSSRDFPEMKLIFPLWNTFVELSQNTSKPFSIGGAMIFEHATYTLIGGYDESLTYAEDHAIIRTANKWGIRVKVLENLKVIISTRRMKKEGRFKAFYKYVSSHLYLFFNDELRNQYFNYEMGGQGYETFMKKKKQQKLKKIEEKFKTLFR